MSGFDFNTQAANGNRFVAVLVAAAVRRAAYRERVHQADLERLRRRLSWTRADAYRTQEADARQEAGQGTEEGRRADEGTAGA